MKNLTKAPISRIFAVASGLTFLATYFLDLSSIRMNILSWVTVLAAAALLLGLLNLLSVHIKRISNKKNVANSSALIISMLATFLITLFMGSKNPTTAWIFNNLIIPVEASLLAVLAVTFTYASLKLLSNKLNLYTGLFLFFFLLTLAGSAPIFGLEIPILQNQIGPWVSTVLAGAGARGILIGVALGTIASGIRVLLGADQPYTD